jgi:CheY-like chemotaxis protein
MKVLIAEDTEINQLMVQNLFDNLPYDYVIVSNGIEAVNKVKTEKFEAIFMDIEMPEMDGIEAMKKIKSIDSRLKIIAMTGYNDKETLNKLIAEGFDEYLIKPFSTEKLSSILNSTTNNAPSGKIDYNYLKNISAGDKDFEIEIVELFLSITPDVLKSIELNIEEKNLENLRREVHKYASQAQLVGLKDAYKLLNEIELSIKSDVSFDSVNALVNNAIFLIKKGQEALSLHLKELKS